MTVVMAEAPMLWPDRPADTPIKAHLELCLRAITVEHIAALGNLPAIPLEVVEHDRLART
jgi:hypothetical protein